METTGRDIARIGDAEFSTCHHCNEGIFRPTRHGVWVHVLTRQPKQTLNGRIHRARTSRQPTHLTDRTISEPKRPMQTGLLPIMGIRRGSTSFCPKIGVMERIAVETTAVAVLAEGGSPSEVGNNQGHLLENFVAMLLETQGFSAAQTENLNTTKQGIEVDVTATHRLTGDKVVCECKAYKSNIKVNMLTSFLGTYALELADNPTCKGFFIGLPRLTAQGKEKAEAAAQKFGGFRYLSSYDICEVLYEAGQLPSLEAGPHLKADPTIVISEHGLALVARELDPDTRRAVRWVVWAKSGSPSAPLLALVERSLSDGLPVVPWGGDTVIVPVNLSHPPTIVEVQGSTSYFEYQLPASPEFFIGRKDVVAQLSRIILQKTTGRSVVINAKSGWGKSSLALRLKREVEGAGGVATVVDTRTADRPEFVAIALERIVRKAVDKDLIELPKDAAFSSIHSIVQTLRASEWLGGGRQILLAFDQFENVFRDARITQEFRDLALLVRDSDLPLTTTFSWKTDMVGWMEDHPYQLRDEIREASHVAILEPFGPRDVESLLRRLERKVGDKIQIELRQRLREYSQGLPWLLKKLAGHIISEIERGTSQDQLVKQSLNVQSLFESDLARLTIAEQDALRIIARSAPVAISDIEDAAISSNVLETLLHQRLIVQVGERLDIYWDTFRDFLVTGQVEIEDSYVIRYPPLGAGRLLRVVLNAGGSLSVNDAAKELNTSATVIFNSARELRLFGVLTTEPNQLVVEKDIADSEDWEEKIRSRVATALRRHKMHSLALKFMADGGGEFTTREFAEALPAEFPTVAAKESSWMTYSRAFCQWMEYAGLAELSRDRVRRANDATASSTRLLSGAVPVRVRSAFPGAGALPAMKTLQHLAEPTIFERPSKSSFRAALRDLTLLGAVELDAGERVALTDSALAPSGIIDVSRLTHLVESQRGMQDAFTRLRTDAGCSPKELGEAHRAALGADWGTATTISTGKFIRSWARACGIGTKLRPS